MTIVFPKYLYQFTRMLISALSVSLSHPSPLIYLQKPNRKSELYVIHCKHVIENDVRRLSPEWHRTD